MIRRMLRQHKTVWLIGLAVVIAFGVGVLWRFAYAMIEPTKEDYTVYRVFLIRLSTDHGWQQKDVALANETSTLSEPRVDNWVPADLRPYPVDKLFAPDDISRFCGAFCGRDFMRKNLKAWPLEAVSQDTVRVIRATRSSENRRVVSVTRIGFDFWHRRAVLMYTADCSDSSTSPSTMCVEFGHAFLQKKSGRWNVNKISAFKF